MASYMAVPPPGRSMRTPWDSASVSSVKSCVTSGVVSKPMTNAWSKLRPDDLVQELDGRFLLELEAVAHRVAGVDEQSDAQRQVGFLAERADRLRGLAVVENSEIVLREVFYEVAALVGDGEDDVDFVHALADDGEIFVGIVGLAGGAVGRRRGRVAFIQSPGGGAVRRTSRLSRSGWLRGRIRLWRSILVSRRRRRAGDCAGALDWPVPEVAAERIAGEGTSSPMAR